MDFLFLKILEMAMVSSLKHDTFFGIIYDIDVFDNNWSNYVQKPCEKYQTMYMSVVAFIVLYINMVI